MTVKETVLQLIDRLPDDVTLEDVQYHLYVLQKIREGEKALKEGRLIPHEEVMKDLAKWLP